MSIIELTNDQAALIQQFEEESPGLVRTIIRNWGRLQLHGPADIGCLFGDVENHPRLGNQRDVHTTRLRYISEEIGIAVTKNTIYILKGRLP